MRTSQCSVAQPIATWYFEPAEVVAFDQRRLRRKRKARTQGSAHVEHGVRTVGLLLGADELAKAHPVQHEDDLANRGERPPTIHLHHEKPLAVGCNVITANRRRWEVRTCEQLGADADPNCWRRRLRPRRVRARFSDCAADRVRPVDCQPRRPPHGDCLRRRSLTCDRRRAPRGRSIAANEVRQPARGCARGRARSSRRRCARRPTPRRAPGPRNPPARSSRQTASSA